MSDAHPWSKKIEDKEGASLEGSDRGWTKENSFRSEARVSAATYLDQDEKFNLRPDLIFDIDSKKVIADTKYKIIYEDDKFRKYGIAQSDLYQMLAYAVRFKIDEIRRRMNHVMFLILFGVVNTFLWSNGFCYKSIHKHH